MARSLGDFRGAYSELESGQGIVTPTHSREHQVVQGPVVDKSSNIFPAGGQRNDDRPTEVHTSQSTVDNDVENILVEGDSTRHREPTQNLRICIGNWLCLLFGLIVVSGSITMTVFGFLANDFSQTVNNVGNITSMERDEALYETLTKLKTYGPIMIGCGCFIIMCACVLLCDAHDRLKASVEPGDQKKDAASINYVDAFRRIYEEEMRQNDVEETKRRTKKIDEYFEYMSRYPIGRRTLLRAQRPRSFSDPCLRLDVTLPDSYEYAKERLRNNPIIKSNNFDETFSDLDVNLSMNQHFIRPSSKTKSASQNSVQNLSPSHQMAHEPPNPTKVGTLPPIKCKSNNGPIKVDADKYGNIPVGSLEKLYLGDDAIVGGTKKKQKKKGKRKKPRTDQKAREKGDPSHPVQSILDADRENTDRDITDKLEIAREARNPVLLDPAKDQLEITNGDKVGGFHLTPPRVSNIHDLEKSDSPLAASGHGRGNVITVASVTSELEPSARTKRWVTESSEQPWNRSRDDDRLESLSNGNDDYTLSETDGSYSNIRKSSTGSLSFEGPNTLGLGHQAMVL